METIYFHNDSLLPLECIKTFGVSVKETDSPIGYFGTGLKYAIAVLLREGCKISLSIGDEHFEFRKETKQIRGKDFELVYMNDEQLPFTTEQGKNWSLWQAYRELYSNCMDENGMVSSESSGFAWNGGTCFAVTGLAEIHEQHSDFILTSTPKYELENLEVHESDKPGIFYRGIRVLELPTKYSYNILSNMTLTEDRTAHQWEVNYELTKSITRSDNIDAVLDILTIKDEQFYEAKMDWAKSVTPSEGFMRLVNEMKVKPHTLNAYYSSHYPTFIGKLDRAVLSSGAQKALNSLRRMLPFKPKSLLVAAMSADYQLNGDEIVLNVELLANRPRLRLAYAVACCRLQHKAEHGYSNPSDYEIIASHMMQYFRFSQPEQAQAVKKSPAKKGASNAK